MSKHVIGIYGASGFGREVMPLLPLKDGERAVFIDDSLKDKKVNGYEVLTYQEFLDLSSEQKSCIVAIADSKVRQHLTEKIEIDGIHLLDLQASNVVILDNNQLGNGFILCPFTTITSNVIVGKSFQANLYSYVAHDCVIGDYVTFAPGVKCNGNVHIEDHVYIGTGAMIKQGTPDKPIVIGKGAMIGMGSVVTKSVKAGDVVFGMPAKSIKRGK